MKTCTNAFNRGRAPLWPIPLSVTLAACALTSFAAMAFETYHDPARNDQGNCAQCHPGFTGGRSDTLHAMHTGGSDPVTGNCNLCHTGSGRDNPFIMWSAGDSGNNGLGCMGCHGQDYGETIQSNYTNNATNPLFLLQGLPKHNGYGLRRHHARSGVALCATCHASDANVPPYAENVIDAGLGRTTHYYQRSDVSLHGKPVHPITNEDSANDTDSVGLDNDGDRAYDGADPDSTNALAGLSIQLTATNTAIFSWPVTYDGWRLQESLTVGPAQWRDLAQVPWETTNGPTWRVVVSPLPPDRFYRLKKSVY